MAARKVESPFYTLGKRFFDVCFALGCLAVFAPVMALIAVAVKLTSPGPVLFLQERLGKDEKPFTIFKFRTMRTDAEAQSGPVWASKNDARVTPIGKFLRNTHLDELPQLFNILRGDMAVVGPRPERPYFIEKFKTNGQLPGYTRRHEVHVGITGYAQIKYPYPELDDIGRKTEADLHYVDNRTFLMDLWIVYRTFLHWVGSLAEALLPKAPARESGKVTSIQRARGGSAPVLAYQQVDATVQAKRASQ